MKLFSQELNTNVMNIIDCCDICETLYILLYYISCKF